MKIIKEIAFLTIIPIIIIVLNLLFLKDLTNFFMSWFDPVYAYLFNGLNLAQGSLDIGHTDHPGTPLQILCAILIRITFLFQGNGSLVDNVFSNPELYLKNISLVLIMLNSVIVFILGYLIFKKTNDLKTAFFLQHTPLVSLVVMFFMPIVACESFLVFCGTAMVMFAFLYTYSNDALKPRAYIIWFSILSALSIATKVSSLPLVFLPLIILKDFKNRFLYLVSTILLFFIFIFPILHQYTQHFDFLSRIFFHTGRFGMGDKGIIESHLFFNNLINIITTEFPFTITFFGLIITSFITIVKRKWFENTDIKQKRLIWGITMVFIFQIIIVAKHYSFHYLIPAYLYSVLGLYGMAVFYKPLFLKYFIKIKPLLWLIIGFIILSGITARLIVNYHFYPKIYNPVRKTEIFLKEYENNPRIIISMGYACAIKEAALYFGLVYSGEKNKLIYARLLKNEYPKTFFYLKERGLYDWQKNVIKNELFSKYNQIIIYAKSADTSVINDNLKSLLEINSQEKLLSVSKIYENKINAEVIFLLTCDTAKMKNLSCLKLDIYSDLEQLDSSKTSFVDSTRNFFFEKGHLQSSENPHSGKYSIKLNKDAPYGLDIKFKLIKNAFFKITVWRNSKSKNGLIVGCSNDPSFYKNGANVIDVGENGWEQVELTFDVTKDIPDNELHIYLWNNGSETIYFDDIHVQGYY